MEDRFGLDGLVILVYEGVVLELLSACGAFSRLGGLFYFIFGGWDGDILRGLIDSWMLLRCD